MAKAIFEVVNKVFELNLELIPSEHLQMVFWQLSNSNFN